MVSQVVSRAEEEVVVDSISSLEVRGADMDMGGDINGTGNLTNGLWWRSAGRIEAGGGGGEGRGAAPCRLGVGLRLGWCRTRSERVGMHN